MDQWQDVIVCDIFDPGDVTTLIQDQVNCISMLFNLLVGY